MEKKQPYAERTENKIKIKKDIQKKKLNKKAYIHLDTYKKI